MGTQNQSIRAFYCRHAGIGLLIRIHGDLARGLLSGRRDKLARCLLRYGLRVREVVRVHTLEHIVAQTRVLAHQRNVAVLRGGKGREFILFIYSFQYLFIFFLSYSFII